MERAPLSTLMELCGEELVYTAIKDESATFIEFEMSANNTNGYPRTLNRKRAMGAFFLWLR